MALLTTANNVATAVIKGGGTRTGATSVATTIDRGGASNVSDVAKGIDINSGNTLRQGKNRFRSKYLRLLSVDAKSIGSESTRYTYNRKLANITNGTPVAATSATNTLFSLSDDGNPTSVQKNINASVPTVG